jgi:hypothetical protein
MALGLLAWLLSRGGKTVTGSDGRKFRRKQAATENNPSIWRTVPDDGEDYFPDLGYDLGNSQATPIMRRFGS